MKRLICNILFAALTMTAFPVLSDAYGIDPAADSAAVVRMKAKMAKIRKVRPTVALVLSGGGA